MRFGRVPLDWMLEDAYPTSFYLSQAPYDAPSLVAGSLHYADQCSQCHGVTGHAQCYRLTRSVAFVRGLAFDEDPADPIATVQAAFALSPTRGA